MRAIHRARPEANEQYVRRHLKQEIGEEEDPGAETIRCRGKPQITVHRQGGEAHIDAVEIGDEVADDQERKKAGRDLRDRAGFQRVFATHDRPRRSD